MTVATGIIQCIPEGLIALDVVSHMAACINECLVAASQKMFGLELTDTLIIRQHLWTFPLHCDFVNINHGNIFGLVEEKLIVLLFPPGESADNAVERHMGGLNSCKGIGLVQRQSMLPTTFGNTAADFLVIPVEVKEDFLKK